MYHWRPEDKSEDYNPQEGTEEASFISLLGMCERCPSEIKFSDNFLFCKPKMVLEEMVPEHGLLIEMEATELYELGVWDMVVRAYNHSSWEMRLEVESSRSA